jgi:hypothetical protein
VRHLLLPGAEKRKQFELRALGLREFAGVNGDQPLDPFALASFARLMVVDFNTIEGLSAESRSHLLGVAVDQWSGGACSRPLPNGWRLVILNPAHGIQRNRATLMEEVAHVFLGHKPNRLAAITSDDASNQSSAAASQSPGRMLARDYNELDEEAAYSVGAAALVPFGGLRRRVMEGRNSREISRHFRVSRQLVEYRIKVTHLWPEYKRLSATRPEHV